MSSLIIENVTVRYGKFAAVEGVTTTIADGTVLGLVGESGSGKSTLARAIVGLTPVAHGRILLDQQDITRASHARRRRIQMVFQDPNNSLDPRMTVGQSISEALAAAGRVARSARRGRVRELLDLVSLDPASASALPRQLSGGQRQRVAIARALAAEPDVLIADEITSALDVSVQASILNLLRDLHRRLGLTVIFISHNLAVVRYVSTHAGVMYLGQLVEAAEIHDLFDQPQHPYTRELLRAVPSLGGAAVSMTETANLEPPDPHHPPAGCRFHTRCPVGPASDPTRLVCRTLSPLEGAPQRAHRAACHFVT
jgi:peptide/nickel transport system ATP-binding protein